MELDIEAFRYDGPSLSTPANGHARRYERRGWHFIVEEDWIAKAASLKGKSPLVVGLMLWRNARVASSRRVRLNLNRASQGGLNKSTLSRGLKALESANLVTVERAVGACSVITILSVATSRVESETPTCS